MWCSSTAKTARAASSESIEPMSSNPTATAARNSSCGAAARAFRPGDAIDHSRGRASESAAGHRVGPPRRRGAEKAHADAFERGSLADGLAAGGFRPDQPTFLWLGVVPYLTRKAIYSTLRFIASVPASKVVFDYCAPPETFAPERRAYLTAPAARVAAAGEPFLSHFDPAELAKELHILGFAELQDLGLAEMAVRFFGAQRVA